MALLPFLAGLAFAVGSAVLGVRAWRALVRARASTSWPSVRGRMIASEAVRFQATSGHRSLFVTHAYEVGGTAYTGSRTAFYTLPSDVVLELSGQMDASPNVRVFYDPQAPGESTLLTGPNPDAPASDLVLAGLGLAVGVGLVAGAATGLIG